MSPVQRLERMLNWSHEVNWIRMHRIHLNNPAASEAEVLALWTEETFRDSVDPGFLARACAEIRRRGTVAS